MIGTGVRPYNARGPWTAVCPGVAPALAGFAVNVRGDDLPDTLDRRLRGSVS